MKAKCIAMLFAVVSTCAFADSSSIVTWGDSLTWGGWSSTRETTYPADLGRMLGRQVFNAGVGGQTSREIAARQGAVPALFGFPGNVIPSIGSATTNFISVWPMSWQGPGKLWGTIKDVHGLLMLGEGTMGNPQLVFKRDAKATNLPVIVPKGTPFHPDTNGMEGWINVFWLGRDNLHQVDQIVSDTDACVKTLTTSHYIVLSILTGRDEGTGTWAYNQAAAVNARFSQTFPGHYLDVRAALIKAYDPTKQQDVADYAMDTVPASLRGDVIHPNDKGYAIIASQVAAFIKKNGW